MYVVTTVFRREFALIPRLVRAGRCGRHRAGPPWSRRHARLILGGLDLHHTGEDALLWPKLLERDAPHTDLIHRMESQHHRVEELIAELIAALPRWEAEARPAVSEEVAVDLRRRCGSPCSSTSTTRRSTSCRSPPAA